MTRPATPRDYPCDWCHASVGSPCTVPNGPRKFNRNREVTWFHDARIKAMEKALANQSRECR